MPPSNPQQERMNYIRSLRDDIMSFYTQEQERITAEELWKLAAHNQTLLGCNTPSFIFEGQWYAAVRGLPGPKEIQKWNKVLHPSLLEPVRELLHNIDFRRLTEQSILQGFFSNILTTAGHAFDVTRLIPSAFRVPILINHSLFNIAAPLPDSEIKKIQSENLEGLRCLADLAMRELLLQKGI